MGKLEQQKAIASDRFVYRELARLQHALAKAHEQVALNQRLKLLDLRERLIEITSNEAIDIDDVHPSLFPRSAADIAPIDLTLIHGLLDRLNGRSEGHYWPIRRIAAQEMYRRKNGDTIIGIDRETGDLDIKWRGAVINRDSWHFHRRLWSRYAIVLAPGDFSAMKAAIVHQKSKRVQRRRGGWVLSMVIPSLDYAIFVYADGLRLNSALPASKKIKRPRGMRKTEGIDSNAANAAEKHAEQQP